MSQQQLAARINKSVMGFAEISRKKEIHEFKIVYFFGKTSLCYKTELDYKYLYKNDNNNITAPPCVGGLKMEMRMWPSNKKNLSKYSRIKSTNKYYTIRCLISCVF